MGKILSGYGSKSPLSQKKGLYGRRSDGKIVYNGGFSGEKAITFETISDERWNSIFGKKDSSEDKVK